jgi:hypothetical protein
MECDRQMGEYVRMPSIWIVIAVVVAAINLRLIVPAILAFLGITHARRA